MEKFANFCLKCLCLVVQDKADSLGANCSLWGMRRESLTDSRGSKAHSHTRAQGEVQSLHIAGSKMNYLEDNTSDFCGSSPLVTSL